MCKRKVFVVRVHGEVVSDATYTLPENAIEHAVVLKRMMSPNEDVQVFEYTETHEFKIEIDENGYIKEVK